MKFKRSNDDILKAKNLLGLASDFADENGHVLEAKNSEAAKVNRPKAKAKVYRRKQDQMTYDEWAFVVNRKLEASLGLSIEDVHAKLLSHLYLHTNSVDEAVCVLTEVLKPTVLPISDDDG